MQKVKSTPDRSNGLCYCFVISIVDNSTRPRHNTYLPSSTLFGSHSTENADVCAFQFLFWYQKRLTDFIKPANVCTYKKETENAIMVFAVLYVA